MASLNNGNMESSQEIDDGYMELDLIQNGDRDSPPQLDDEVVKVVVIGEPGCGKTSFIRAFYDHHYPGVRYTHNGVPVYPCEFKIADVLRRVSIYEIPSDPGFIPEQRIPHYEQTDVIVFLYAIDDLSSLQQLAEKWIVEAFSTIEAQKTPVVFAGTKKDLRDSQQVKDHPALNNKSHVTIDQAIELFNLIPSETAVTECSAYDWEQIEDSFRTILAMV